jgi:hypothetical protein
MLRRSFLLLLATPVLAQNLRKSRSRNSDPAATSSYIYSQTMRRIAAEKWNRLPIGDLMGNIGTLLLGTPYVGGTLEGAGPEICRADLTGLDCVTFFENVLAMARCSKLGTPSWNAFIKQITRTRYRDGQLDGYTSRLHYTAEWIENNVAKGVVRDVTPDLGGDVFPIRVSFMSEHPQYYPPLKADTSLVGTIASIERRLATTTRYIVPREKIADIEPLLKTGDIVAIATSKAGLDYAHTGLIVREGSVARLMHASVTKKKVILDVRLSDYIASVKSHIGVSILRPIEPNASSR